MYVKMRAKDKEEGKEGGRGKQKEGNGGSKERKNKGREEGRVYELKKKRRE